MAALDRGFANENFVLINGDFWNLPENRRYVQAHAWLVEFTHILLEWIRSSGNPNPRWILSYWDKNSRQLIETVNTSLFEKGPLEILKFCEKKSFYIAHNASSHISLGRRMTEIRRLRNNITHNSIENSEDLKKLLGEMKGVCELSLEPADRQHEFASRCQEELNNAMQFPADY